MTIKIKLTCGTAVPAEVLDKLAWRSMHPYTTKEEASGLIRKWDAEGKLLEKLEEVLGWTPPKNGKELEQCLK